MGLPRSLTSFKTTETISSEGVGWTFIYNRNKCRKSGFLRQKYTIFSPFWSIKALFDPFLTIAHQVKI